MKINTLVYAGILLASGAIAPAVHANSTIVLNQVAYYYGDGGEFTAVNSPDNFAQFYAPDTSNFGTPGSFQTFCVEESVYFWGNVTYNYTLSYVDSQGRDLTEGAAFLYSEFAQGILPCYDYSNTGAVSRSTDAGLLQSALWELQGGQFEDGFPSGDVNNPFYTLAENTLGANLLAPSDGAFGVQILELWDSNDNTYQNQLVYDNVVNTPDEASTCSLFAIGLAFLAFFARKHSLPKVALQPVAGIRPSRQLRRLR